jgi:hypothetical protein
LRRHRLAGAISQILVDALIGEGWEIPAFSHTPGGFASLPAVRSSSKTSQSGFQCRPPTVRAAGARRDDSRGARLQGLSRPAGHDPKQAFVGRGLRTRQHRSLS